MKRFSKDDLLTLIAIVLLFFTAFINWNIYSWLILCAIVILLIEWNNSKSRR